MTVLTAFLYFLSVIPAHLEHKLGIQAYNLCGKIRTVSFFPMLVVFINYGIYLQNPKPIWGLPITFANFWIQLLGLFIALTGAVIFGWGMHDAGKETMRPNKDQQLHRGIYSAIRHPQALGEMMIWIAIGLILDSPFLTVYGGIWLLVYLLWSIGEEWDLILRFGNLYMQYRKTTGFLFPKLTHTK